MEPSSSQPISPAIPIAIVCGFALIAIAILFTSRNQDHVAETTTTPEDLSELAGQEPRPVDKTDYIRGNPNAPILIVEYSDYECAFCNQFHTTLSQIMDEYGVGGKVAWVYRQFPIAEIHPNAPYISEAALCVGDIGGNRAFWEFTDTIYRERNLDELTNLTKLPDYAEAAGVSKQEYLACLESGRMNQAVQLSIVDAYNAGARGTPHSVIMVGNQEASINGAESYDFVKGVVDNLISQLASPIPLNQTTTTQAATP